MTETQQLSEPLKAVSSLPNDPSTPLRGTKTKAPSQDSGQKIKLIKFSSPSPVSEDITAEGKQPSKLDLEEADSLIKRARVDSAVQSDIDLQQAAENNRIENVLAEARKVALGIINQKDLNRSDTERIHNAAGKARVKLTYDLQKDSTTFTCRLFIAGTLISAADGNSKKIAKFKASEQAVGILLDSSDSYSKLRKIIEQSIQSDSLSSTGEPQMSGASRDISCASFDKRPNNGQTSSFKDEQFMEKDTLCELDINQTKLNLENEFGKALIENFVVVIESALEKHDSFRSIIFAAGVLKIQHTVQFKYGAGSSSKENVICKLCLKNILVGVGSGMYKNAAKQAAAAYALHHLLNSKLWCCSELDGKVATKDLGDKSSCNSEGPRGLDQKKYVLMRSDDPEEHPLKRLAASEACSVSDGDVKNISTFIENLAVYDIVHPTARIFHAAQRAKVFQLISYDITVDELSKKYVCELHFKNILISTGTGHTKAKCKQSAAHDAVGKLLHLKHFIIEERNHGITLSPDVARFEINQSLLASSMRRQFVLMYYSKNKSAASILRNSASFSHKPLIYEHSEQPMDDGSLTSVHKFDVLLDGAIVGMGSNFSKEKARHAAGSDALQNLKKVVYTIMTKAVPPRYNVIRRYRTVGSQLGSDSNTACKMLQAMGWTSRIVEPRDAPNIQADDANADVQVLGFYDAGNDIVDFREKVHVLLGDFKNSDSFNDLLLIASDFSKEERKEVHNVASRLLLKSRSCGVDRATELLIQKRFTATQLLDHLVKVGGSTTKYDLLDLSGD